MDVLFTFCSLDSHDGGKGVSCQSKLQWECGSRSLSFPLYVDDYDVSVESRMTKGRDDNEDDVEACER